MLKCFQAIAEYYVNILHGKKKIPHREQGEHANSTIKTVNRRLEPSCCEPTVASIN